MANTNYESLLYVEDYTAITTTVVPADGQERFYENAPGFRPANIVRVVGDGTSTVAQLVASALRDIHTFDRVDTTSGDVAATTPSSPWDGQKWTVVNEGSGGNHVTGLPGSISLADDFTITFTYDADSTTWRYENVIVDCYTSGDQKVFKDSCGKMEITGDTTFTFSSASSTNKTITYAETFVTYVDVVMSGGINTSSSGFVNIYPTDADNLSGFTPYAFTTGGGSISDTTFSVSWTATGRWKA